VCMFHGFYRLVCWDNRIKLIPFMIRRALHLPLRVRSAFHTYRSALDSGVSQDCASELLRYLRHTINLELRALQYITTNEHDLTYVDISLIQRPIHRYQILIGERKVPTRLRDCSRAFQSAPVQIIHFLTLFTQHKFYHAYFLPKDLRYFI
jgi:hypothetical protein